MSLSPLTLAVLLIIGGFLLGSIPFGWIAARLAGRDIRSVGSGNIGATNVWRALGWKWGLSVLLLDALKGYVPVIVAQQLLGWSLIPCLPLMFWIDGRFYFNTEYLWNPYMPLFVGLAAILGHTFTPWLRFKGGKGVATGLGVAIALYQVWILIPLAVFLLALFATRMVSVGSICAAIALGLLSAFVPYLIHLSPFGVLAALLVVWTHRANIKRILAGTENKVSLGRRTMKA